MQNTNKTYDLKVEKTIAKPAAEVFRAIGEGRLFMNCGADQESLQVDFKVGGQYSIAFLNYGMNNRGEFLEIVPYSKISFTWCQDYESNPTPDTNVIVELKEEGGKTQVTITHTGFKDQENCDGHTGGWTSGLEDLSEEIANGKVRLVRMVALPIDRFYEKCKNPTAFLGVEGKTLEASADQKLVFDLKDSKLTLVFDTEDEKSSWVELIHEGLTTDTQQKAARAKWDSLLKNVKN